MPEIKIHKEKPATVERPCISCRKPFESEGAHHRMCGRCRTDAGRVADLQSGQVGDGRAGRFVGW